MLTLYTKIYMYFSYGVVEQVQVKKNMTKIKQKAI